MSGRTTRIAVTLSLVIATMIQPVSAYARAKFVPEANCGMFGQAEQPLRCDGCGCCPVETSGDRCCCCGHGEDERLDETSESIDGSISVEQQGVTTPDLASCHCGVSTPPMNQGNQREQLLRGLSLKLPALEFCVLGHDRPGLIRLNGTDVGPGNRADFSQRVFCVWRI